MSQSQARSNSSAAEEQVKVILPASYSDQGEVLEDLRVPQESELAESAEPAQDIPEIPEGFKKQSHIAEGGMCIVDEVEQEGTHGVFALKRLKGDQDNPLHAELLVEEVARVNILLNSPDISDRVKEHFPDFALLLPGHPRAAAVFERLGESVGERLENGIGAAEGLEIFSQILDSVEAFSAVIGTHGDLNTSAFCFGRNDRVKFADLSSKWSQKQYAGSHKATRSTEFSASDDVMIGTGPYMAPEQWRGQADERTDIYQLGTMMSEILGQAVTPSLQRVVVKCRKQDPEDRYQTIGELRQAVQTAAIRSKLMDKERLTVTPRLGDAVVGILRVTRDGWGSSRDKGLIDYVQAYPIELVSALALPHHTTKALEAELSREKAPTERALMESFVKSAPIFGRANKYRTKNAAPPIKEVAQLLGASHMFSVLVEKDPALAGQVLEFYGGRKVDKAQVLERVQGFYEANQSDRLKLIEKLIGEEVKDENTVSESALLRGMLSVYFDLSATRLPKGAFAKIGHAMYGEPVRYKDIIDRKLIAEEANFLYRLTPEEKPQQPTVTGVNEKLRWIVSNVDNGSQRLSNFCDFVDNSRAISVHDLNFLLKHLPPGINWGRSKSKDWSGMLKAMGVSQETEGVKYSDFCPFDVLVPFLAIQKTTDPSGAENIGAISKRLAEVVQRSYIHRDEKNNDVFRNKVTNKFTSLLVELQGRIRQAQ